MKLSMRRLAVELTILSCMVVLKAIDLQTDCVATTMEVLKRAVDITPLSESACAGLWEAYGGLGPVISADEASGRVYPVSDSASKRQGAQGAKAGLNLATAHHQLAASEFWKWKNRDGN